MTVQQRQCQEPACIEKAIRCVIRAWKKGESDHVEWYCPEHASKNGYCAGCGIYSAGTDGFDWPTVYGNVPGFCDTCSDEIESDVGEDCEEEL